MSQAHPTSYWTVDRRWAGLDCYVAGGGPSLRKLDVGRLDGCRVIAVNDAFKVMPRAQFLFFGDRRWWVKNMVAVAEFAGEVVTPDHANGNPPPPIRVLRRLKGCHPLNKHRSTISWNQSSGAAAVNLASLLGATRIVLLGFDMRAVDGEANWHNFHNPPTLSEKTYARFRAPFGMIAESAREAGIEIVNATPGSALTEFPIVDPDDVLPVTPSVDGLTEEDEVVYSAGDRPGD